MSAPESLRRRLRETLSVGLADAEGRLGGELAVEDQRALCQSLLGQGLAAEAEARLRAGDEPLGSEAAFELRRAVLADVLGAGGLDAYLADPTVSDVIAQGAANVHVIHVDGRRRRVAPLAGSDEELVELIRTLARENGARLDAAGVEANFALPDGSRVFAALGVAPFPVVVVRRHHLAELASLADLVRVGMADTELADLAAAMIRARMNVVVSGGAATGKSTLLRCLLADGVGAGEHVVTVEDTYELQLHRDRARHPMVSPWLARPANTEGAGAVSLGQLTRMALRASPDRVVVGEVRGGAEVLALLDAMTAGQQGSATTVHAPSSRQALTRLAAYAVASGVLRLEEALFIVATAVDFVLHVARRSDGRRVLASVREVSAGGADGLLVPTAEIYAPSGPGGRAAPTGVPISPERAAALADAGFRPGGRGGLSLAGRWP